MTIDRRLFLKVSGAVAVVAGVSGALSGVQRLTRSAVRGSEVRSPGSYVISGRVRLQAPVVTISGITNAQQISWSPGSLRSPIASFSSFERFDRPWRTPPIQVSGGQLEALQIVPLDIG
jgi:hypothetical protein